MISGDDVLRYVPFAALHDGQRYLVERYALSSYNPTTRDVVVSQPTRPQWRVAAFGATQERPLLGFTALPDVATELRAVVRQDGEQLGALPGERKLDAEFTRNSLSQALRKRYPAVHVASHFRLVFNDPNKSVMLLGDGQTLPIGEFTGNPVDFRLIDIDLLTLSACETAVPAGHDSATGMEVESLSALVHQAGARSVLATLWPVADRATASFMGRFYGYLSNNSLSKANALSRAQQDFIQGRAAPEIGREQGFRGRGATVVGSEAEQRTTTTPSDLTHPYFWAPFTLLGNWM